VARALADSRIRSADLSHIVLAGGATRMPAVRRLAATLFGRVPRQTIDPDQVVALGAAVQAGLKMRDAALTDIVLTDVAPYTLGIEVVEFMGAVGVSAGRLLPVIERNTVVPVSRTKTVTPVHDFQQRVEVRIYQGESRLVKDNILLGTLCLRQQTLAGETTTLAPDDHAAEIGTFLRKLAALRYAGDIDAAIRAIEGLFATRQPGDPVLDGIGDALFQTVALERSLSVRLFCHLVARFDWRDASGGAAQADPQRHSILLARVAAEDWYQELLTQAAKPDGIVAACAVARGGVLPLPPHGLDKPQKEDAKVLMNALWERGEFLLERFDTRPWPPCAKPWRGRR
jgi:hypothetical protein